MKYLILLAVILTACSGAKLQTERREPKFGYMQGVRYKVPSFYKIVCSGVGKIVGYEFDRTGVFRYDIDTPMIESKCPFRLTISEENIEEIK